MRNTSTSRPQFYGAAGHNGSGTPPLQALLLLLDRLAQGRNGPNVAIHVPVAMLALRDGGTHNNPL